MGRRLDQATDSRYVEKARGLEILFVKAGRCLSWQAGASFLDFFLSLFYVFFLPTTVPSGSQ